MKNNKEHKISIIVPVYNAEKYLSECLDSLINQTYRNIEVLCINDGSKDNSLSILEKYAQKDNRIKVFSQKNSGPAMARNVGLTNANGEYLMFCDADDTYQPNMCSEMINSIVKYKTDLIMCNTNGYDKNLNPENNSYYMRYDTGVYPIDNEIKIKTNVYLWNKIYKKEIIDNYNIKFPVGHKSDDNYFVWAYLASSKNIYILDKKLYNHYERENSIMDIYKSSNIRYEDLEDHMFVLKEIYEFLNKNNLLTDNINFMQFIIYNELLYCWSHTPEIWENKFLTDYQNTLNEIKLETYNKNSIHNLIIQNIISGNFTSVANNLNIQCKNNNIRTFKYVKQEDLKPAFEVNNIPIVFNADNNFAKYCSVAIQSIIENSDANYNYDIIILNSDITNKNQLLLKSMIEGYKNFSIRFYNITNILKQYNVQNWFRRLHISRIAYSRIFAPIIFKNFKKIIYLDADLIVLKDIKELYNADLQGKSVGAVKDYYISLINEDNELWFKGFYNYAHNVLRINNLKSYFNSGVMLLDIEQIIKKNYLDDFIKIAQINNMYCHDQNVLNSVLQNDVILLSDNWNYQLQLRHQIDFLNDNETYNIIHFSSDIKPWSINQEVSYEIDLWWKYARKSPYYENLIVDLSNSQIGNLNASINDKEQNLFNIIRWVSNKHKIKFNYYKSKILAKLTFGKTREHYKNKKQKLKQKIRTIRMYTD